MEAAVIEEADAVVFVTDEAAQLVMRKYPDEWRRKVAVVPHGFAAPMTAQPSSTPRRRPGPMRFVHAGRFYNGLRTPLPLLRALAQLNSTTPLAGMLEVTLVGPHTTGYATEVSALGLNAIVRLHDRVSPGDARAIASGADVLLVIDAPSSIPSPYLPSKLVDYLPLRKPILGITPLQRASSALLRRLGGFVAAPNDEGAIRIALTHVLRRWRDGALGVGQEFDRVAAEYDITKTTAKFSDVLTRAFA